MTGECNNPNLETLETIERLKTILEKNPEIKKYKISLWYWQDAPLADTDSLILVGLRIKTNYGWSDEMYGPFSINNMKDK